MKLSPAQRKVLEAMAEGKGICYSPLYMEWYFLHSDKPVNTRTAEYLIRKALIKQPGEKSQAYEITEAGRKALEGGK